MTGRASIRAVSIVVLTALLALSACGGKSDKSNDSASSDKPSKSASASSSSSPSASTSALASPQVPDLAGPLPTKCLSAARVSADFGFGMVLLSTTPANGVLECKYLSGKKPQRVLIARISNIKADQASGSYGRITHNYQATLKTQGEDAGVGTESRIFQTQPFNAALVAHDADGTTVIMTFLSPGATKLRPKFLQVATDVMKKY